MANGAFDPEARYAQLDERVANQGSRISQLEQSMNLGFRQLEKSVADIGAEFRSNQKPQWQAISVAATITIAFMGLIGTLAYLPVTAGLRDAREDIRANAKDALSVEGFKDFKATYENNRVVYRQEVEAKIATNAADLRALEARIREDGKAIVPRGEHEEHWRSQDAQDANLQRQIDEVKAQAGSTYGVRDVIQRLEKQVEDLREEKYRAMMRPPS